MIISDRLSGFCRTALRCFCWVVGVVIALGLAWVAAVSVSIVLIRMGF